ncbi:replication factor C small subunit [Haloarchaeobius sp. DT45]|uniref:replication factor C small subunit n=1 Tax=Haloarchaeobius sp. DT45 TaxID=3446116 RepID=UPI003F6BEBFD
MSEADETGARPGGRNEVWIEKYRPDSLDDVVGHEDIIGRLQSYIAKDELPHLMFAGPAGVGKCVTGETPVLTNRGIERIEDVVGDVDGFAEPDDDLQVVTFDAQGNFEYVTPSKVFGKQADNVVKVATRDGNQVTVTPEHRLLVLSADGLEWRQAKDVESGDRVVRPRSTPVPEGEAELDWLDEVDPNRIYADVSADFAAEHNLTYQGTTDRVPLSTLLDLDISRDRLYSEIDRIEYVNANGYASTPIEVTNEVTPRLASFLGLTVSEARIDNGRIRFYNTDDTLLDEFEQTVIDLFGLEPTRGEQGGTPFVRVISQTLTHFLESCFDVFDGATSGDGIGSALVRADDEARAAFCRAMFDAEGYVADNGILELTQKNGDHITLLSYLLSSFGIPSRRTVKRKAATNGSGKKREYHVLSISGAPNVRRFEDAIGFTIDYKAEALAKHTEKDSNPNHDTIPVQSAVDDVCQRLHIDKNSVVPESLNPETPGRETYETALRTLLVEANDRLETAQAVHETTAEIRADIKAVSKTPATWVGSREQLGPLTTRKEVAAETGVRTDRLLEYSDGRRAPTARRAEEILVTLGEAEGTPPVRAVQNELASAIDALGVSFNRVGDEAGVRGADVANLVRTEDHDIASLTRFETVTEAIESIANEMLSVDVLDSIQKLEALVSADLYYDEVESVDPVDEETRVYDLTVPESHNYVAGAVPTVMHNTASAVSIAKEIYGDEWRENFLELNASDQRGIDVVRDRIKNFARTSFGGYDYRIIFLDEADALTSDAQSALRRTMEQFSNNTRFILSCNYSSQIIDPIQSRCAVFRFTQLADDAVATQVRYIAGEEGIPLTDEGVDALVYAADGDMRKAINALQAASVMGDEVSEETVYAITATARPEEVEAMVTDAIAGDFIAARAKLDELLTERGLAGGDIIDQLHRSAWEFDLSEEAAVRLMDRVGEADFRITQGASERVQLEALLASLALD